MLTFFFPSCLLNVIWLLCHLMRDSAYFLPFKSSPDTSWVGGFWPILRRPSCCEKTSLLPEVVILTLVSFKWGKWWKGEWMWKSPVDVITPSSQPKNYCENRQWGASGKGCTALLKWEAGTLFHIRWWIIHITEDL